jgi:hypothetical protein
MLSLASPTTQEFRRAEQSRKIEGLGGHDSARFVFGADLAATAITKRSLRFKIPRANRS